jgi:eukaryotic-like serine/threonine-protein kinase
MNLEDLQRDLVALRLVETSELDDALRKLATPTADGLLAGLEAAGVITPFVSDRLRKGETDGLVLGDYKLMYRNASGSFARVYRAKSIVDGSMVGLKLLRQRWAEDPKFVDQFHQEAELGKKLRHPNIAPIHHIGVTGKHHWFTMEFVEGGNLRDFIQIRGKIAPVECLKYLRGMASGLEYALSQGFTHRDLKMTNVLMSSSGEVKLIDFGLAGQGIRAVESDQSRAIEYAAIEKATNAPNNDPRTDLYFLGAIAYELLAGEPPYPRTRDREARANIARYRNVRPIERLLPDLAPSIVTIVDRLLQVDPRQRYARPADVVQATNRALSELGESTAKPGNGRPAEPAKTTLLCVEDRKKHQDMLREYFTKHGYRVLVLTNVDRALDRLDRDPPDCVVLMGGSIGRGIVESYGTAVERARKSGTAVVTVLSEKQADLEGKLKSSPAFPVMSRVATLRELRAVVDAALAARRKA